MKGFGLSSVSGVCRGLMPPQLKTKQSTYALAKCCKNDMYLKGRLLKAYFVSHTPIQFTEAAALTPMGTNMLSCDAFTPLKNLTEHSILKS